MVVGFTLFGMLDNLCSTKLASPTKTQTMSTFDDNDDSDIFDRSGECSDADIFDRDDHKSDDSDDDIFDRGDDDNNNGEEEDIFD